MAISRCPCSCCCACFFASVWRCSTIAGACSSSDCFCFSCCCSPCLFVSLWMFSICVRLGSVCRPCFPSFSLSSLLVFLLALVLVVGLRQGSACFVLLKSAFSRLSALLIVLADLLMLSAFLVVLFQSALVLAALVLSVSTSACLSAVAPLLFFHPGCCCFFCCRLCSSIATFSSRSCFCSSFSSLFLSCCLVCIIS